MGLLAFLTRWLHLNAAVTSVERSGQAALMGMTSGGSTAQRVVVQTPFGYANGYVQGYTSPYVGGAECFLIANTATFSSLTSFLSLASSPLHHPLPGTRA